MLSGDFHLQIIEFDTIVNGREKLKSILWKYKVIQVDIWTVDLIGI